MAASLRSRTYSYSEPQLYSQNSGGSYFDTQGGSSQVTTVVTSHGMAGGGDGGLTMELTGGQIISSSGTYIVGAASMDNSSPHPAAQTTRASPATVSHGSAPSLPFAARRACLSNPSPLSRCCLYYRPYGKALKSRLSNEDLVFWGEFDQRASLSF